MNSADESIIRQPQKCLICNVETGFSNRSVTWHLKTHNLSRKDYYDRFFKKSTEGICIVCQKPTKFLNSVLGYQTTCSNSCGQKNPATKQKIQKIILEKYGTTNIMQSDHFKTQSKQTCLKLYGVENVSQSLTIQNKKIQTNIQKCGKSWESSTKEFRQKVKNTCLKKFGCENPLQNKEILEKQQQTCLEKYGVKFVSQYKEIHDKQMKHMYHHKKYILPSGKNIIIQGFEPRFLDYIFKYKILNEDEIDYSPQSIKYTTDDNDTHYYYPDFYIPKWNLIIEIKSSWTIKLDPNIIFKKKSVIEKGFKYLMIINDKTRNLNFLEFEQLLISLRNSVA